MRDYAAFWRRVAEYVPTRRRLMELEQVVAEMERDYDEEIQALRDRVDALERSAIQQRLEKRKETE